MTCITGDQNNDDKEEEDANEHEWEALNDVLNLQPAFLRDLSGLVDMNQRRYSDCVCVIALMLHTLSSRCSQVLNKLLPFPSDHGVSAKSSERKLALSSSLTNEVDDEKIEL
jgi:hypothetical protein